MTRKKKHFQPSGNGIKMVQNVEVAASGDASDNTSKEVDSTTSTKNLSAIKEKLVNGITSTENPTEEDQHATAESKNVGESTKTDNTEDNKNSENQEESAEKALDEPPVELGSRSDVSKLYAVPKRGDGDDSDDDEKLEWQNTVPENLGKPAENDETAKSALVARFVKTYNDSRRVLKLHSVSVQSSRLKKLLGRVFQGYSEVTTDLDRLEFSEDDYGPLVHRWDQLEKEIGKIGNANEDERITKEHAVLFRDLAHEELKECIDKTQDMMVKSVITYEYLWALFQPDDIIYARVDGKERAFSYKSGKFKDTEHSGVRFEISCEYVDWDGKRFGHREKDLVIQEFGGTRRISSLSAYPIRFHPRKEKLMKQLLERGKKFETYTDAKHVTYDGHAWRPAPYPRLIEKHSVTGRIIVDTHGWNVFCADYNVEVTRFRQDDYKKKLKGIVGDEKEDDDHDDAAEKIECTDGEDGEEEEGEDSDNTNDDTDNDTASKNIPELVRDKRKKQWTLTERQRLIANPDVRGYSFTKKLWLNFQVSRIKEIEWNERAFDCLVLPDNQKELILGFSESHGKHSDSFDDFIVGKGKGIILLLCGPPGVGKTLSAAAVAEHMKVPLFSMTAGDLGYYPSDVEENLQQVWEICCRWSAVLLIDEADIFLEERSVHELERNKLVTVFLRVLEQFSGIMFLTTNRVETFDPAFQSRIHISLEYNELSPKSRRQVWKNFLEPLAAEKRHCLTDIQIDKLSRMSMNGRQIKNVLKIAHLLALNKEKPLAYEHIMNVLDVTQHLHKTQQATDKQRSSIFL